MKNRIVALAAFATMLLLIPANVLWYGIPVLWRAYPGDVRRAWLTLLRGKRGPYEGVVW